ncbi:MAG: O-antigen ligase family protein [Sporocytophaga sp.]|nr:O-antigen ligase family protein [Sporocytophaga sp.]
MVTFSVFLSYYLLEKNYFNDFFFKGLNIIILIFLIFYQHLLAVRSGLVAFYVVLILITFYLLASKNFKKGLLLFFGIIAIIGISFFSLNTLKNKWGYTKYDWNLSDIKEKANNYSIGKRLVSQQVTFQLFREHPIFGVGEGNLESEVRKGYAKNFPYVEAENRLSPHNQYLRTLAATGILGFIIFLSCFYFPLFSNKNYRSKILLAIYAITSVSFLFEDTLETKTGLTFCLFFIMFSLHYTKSIRMNVNNSLT